MADVIGRAIIEVAPDVSRFARQLSRDLKQVTRNFKKISVGVSVGSIRKAFVEVSKLNLALRAATIGFAALGAKTVVAGLLSAASAAVELSGALAVLPAVGAAAAVAVGALAVGLHGVDAVLKAFVKGDMEKFNEALKELSPNARQALGVIKEFAPELEGFKNAVQDALFRNLAPVLRDVGTKLLPLVQLGFTGVATEFNRLARDLGKFATSRETLRDLSVIFTNIRDAFHTLVPAGTAFATAIRDIVAVGSSFLPGIAATITVMAEGFAAFIARARESGALQDFIGRGLASLERLITAIVNLGQAFGGVLRAANDAGFGLLDIITGLAARFDAWANSIEGQGALRKFFVNARVAAEALAPVLGAIGRFFNDQFIPLVSRIAVILGPSLVIFIDAIGDAFDAARPGIEAFAAGVGKFLEGIAPALPAIGLLAGAIGRTLGTVLERIAPVLNDVITVLADAFTQAISNPVLIDGIVALATGFGEFLKAIAPSLPAIAELAGTLASTLGTVLERVGPKLNDLITAIAEALTEAVSNPDLIDGIVDLVGAFADFLIALTPLIPILAKIAAAILPVMVKVLEALMPLVEALAPLFEGLAAVLKPVGVLLKFAAIGLGALLVPIGLVIQQIGDLTKFIGDFVTASVEGFDDALVSIVNFATGQEVITGFVQSAHGNLVDRLPNALGVASSSIDDFWLHIQQEFRAGNTNVEAKLRELNNAMASQVQPAGQIGSALGGEFTGGLNRNLIVAKDVAFGAVANVRGELNNRIGIFGSGAAIGDDFVAGIISRVAEARRAALLLMQTVRQFFPSSPAERGPFSGRGWTPFRGQALVEGFARGMTDNLGILQRASRRVADSSTIALGGTGVAPNTRATPSTVIRPSAPQVTATTGPVSVQVLLDGRELRTLAVEVVEDRDRALLRRIQAGTGGAR